MLKIPETFAKECCIQRVELAQDDRYVTGSKAKGTKASKPVGTQMPDI